MMLKLLTPQNGTLRSIMILGILQARISSRRLPGKVLKPLQGKPMLVRQIERIQRAKRIDKLVMATSSESTDDSLAHAIGACGTPVYRGSLDDVLDRFYQAAVFYQPEHVVRLTGDCPLADPEIIDHVIKQHLMEKADYSSNVLPPTYPDGLDVEVMRFTALEQAWREAELPSDREHVTPFIRNHPERFMQLNVPFEKNLSALRWTVDEPEDFQLIEQIYQALYPDNPFFLTADILALLQERPELMNINTQIGRNEGEKKSYEADKRFLEKKMA